MKYSYPTLSEVGDRSALISDLNQIVVLKKICYTVYFWFFEKVVLSKFVLKSTH